MAGKHGGARPNSGRKSKAQELRELKLLNDAVSDNDWIDIFQKIAEKATKGDMMAARLLIERAFGKAKEHVTLVGDDDSDAIKVTLNING